MLRFKPIAVLAASLLIGLGSHPAGAGLRQHSGSAPLAATGGQVQWTLFPTAATAPNNQTAVLLCSCDGAACGGGDGCCGNCG